MINSKNRFKGHKSLNYVYRHGKLLRSTMFALKYAKNKKRQDWRLAVVVSKKVEPIAVKRNRIRRRVFETIRTNLPDNFSNIDMVVTIYDRNIKEINQEQLVKSFKEVLTTVKLD